MQHSSPTTQRGFILVVSLLLLLVMSLLAVHMFGGAGLQSRMAGNVKDKTRAVQAADAALRYAETLLANSGTTPLAQATTCSGTLAVPTLCSNAVSVQNPGLTTPLTLGSSATYTSLLPAASLSTAGGAGTYYANPVFYIQYLGTANGSQAYQVTALGYGGSPDAAAVVQSTYTLSSGVQDLGGL